MYIYEYSKCDKCSKAYKGVFQVKDTGNVECIDCDNAQYIGEPKYEVVSEGDQDVVQEIVKDLLMKDLNRIYLTEVEEGKDELHSLRDEEGNLDSRKVYFQNNSIDFILKLQRAAYTALTYIERGKGLEHREFAKEIYEAYIQSRIKKYTETEIKDLVEKIDSEEMECIEREVKM